MEFMNKKAFTLIELLVVMVIMAVVAAMTIPAFISIGRGDELNGAVRSLCSTLSLIKQWSITHKEPTDIVIETNCFFTLSGNDGITNIVGSIITNGGYDGKLVADDYCTEQLVKPDGSTIVITFYHYSKISRNYLIYMTGCKSDVLIKSDTKYPISNKTLLSDPVIYKGVKFQLVTLFSGSSQGNSLSFVSTGGLKVTSDYRIDCTHITKSAVGKTILVRWLTGNIKVSD